MKVFKFDSTAEAYDATQCRDDIKKGSILVIKSEGVVGIADAWPVAVTKEHGELHTVADGYSLRDATFGFDSEIINKAHLIAIKHGWPVDESTATKWLRIPKSFVDDHRDRDLDTPVVGKETGHHYYVRRDDPALAELISDASYYADPNVGWIPEVAHIRRAAKWLIAALKRQGVAI